MFVQQWQVNVPPHPSVNAVLLATVAATVVYLSVAVVDDVATVFVVFQLLLL